MSTDVSQIIVALKDHNAWGYDCQFRRNRDKICLELTQPEEFGQNSVIYWLIRLEAIALD